jgi:tRNA-dihydrouridine synthase 2
MAVEMPYAQPSNCLAPMVRVNTLPMRLLALEYGADLVYSEEIVAHKLISCAREKNPELGTIDWRKPPAQGHSRGQVVLRTANSERSRLVVQLGAADATSALAAAQHVADRVAAVDLNMGCPMKFYTSGGMGSALLRAPDTAADILQTLRRNLAVPVTCKIRLLQSAAETLELARRLESCGVAAVAVHCREVHQRSARTPARWHELRPLVDALCEPDNGPRLFVAFL